VGVESQFSRSAPTRPWRRVPMGFQVWLGVGGLLVLLAGSILVAVLLIVGLGGHEKRLNERVVPYSSALAAAALEAKGAANDERGFLLTGNSRFIGEADRRIESARVWFAASAAAAAGGAQRRAVAEARYGFERWVSGVRQEFATFQSGDRRGPITASLGPDRALRKRYEASLARAQLLATRAIRSMEASVAAASSRSIAILLIYLLAALVIGAGVAYWLVRSIANPVARLVAILGPS
jgi:methyl-accepting chemotaxis protein